MRHLSLPGDFEMYKPAASAEDFFLFATRCGDCARERYFKSVENQRGRRIEEKEISKGVKRFLGLGDGRRAKLGD
jgi:hypothetical protein